METPTAVVAGAVLTLFGGALLLWCAAEVRLRHHLRRHGIPAAAQVVADGDPYGELYGDTYGELDSAPLLAYTALPAVEMVPVRGSSDAGAAQPVRAAEAVLARPRGSTPLRRPTRLVPGAIVQVMYDARRPSRVVLAGPDILAGFAADIFWTLLGAAALAGGLSLFALLLSH